MPFPCRSHAVPLPCHEYAFLKANSQDRGRVTAGERHGIFEFASAVQRRHVSDLPAFGFFLLPRGVPGSLLSEAYQSEIQVVSMKQSNVCHSGGKLIILLQEHECLYNLQHKDYDKCLVKDNCWVEIAGEWQGRGRGTAWYV
jgi:hypothetical protein